MTSKSRTILAIVVLVCVGIGIATYVHVSKQKYGAVGNIEQYLPYVLYNGGINTALPIQTSAGITMTGLASLLVNLGTTVVNNFTQGGSGYSQTITTTGALTAAQFCASTAILVPQSVVSPITITYPTAAAAYTACAAVPGGWQEQWIDNESSVTVTIATSTNDNINIMVASTTGAVKVTTPFPQTVPASTSLRIEGTFPDSTHLNQYGELYVRAYK